MAYGQVNSPSASGADIVAAKQLAQQAADTARATQTTANTALSTADAAMEKANAAELAAGNAATAAATAQETANSALSAAQSAQTTATAAQSTANSAKTTAEQAAQTAAAAQQAANDVSQALTDLNSTINTVPSQAGTLSYTGSAQTPTWNGYDSTKMTLSVTAKTNAGTYDATVTPKDGFKWPDGSTTAKTITWKITPATVAIPTVSQNPTYTGSAVSPTWNGYDTAKMTLNSGGSSTNVGSVTAKFQVKTNYQWPDGSTGEKSVSWSINKAAGSLSLNKSSMTLNVSALTGTIGVTRAGDGAISAISSNTSVATVSVSGTTVTVTGKAKGSATITVSVAAGTNHTAPASKTCSVTVTLPTATLSDNDWDVVGQVSSSGVGANYWAVGDTKPITLNGTVGILTLSNLTVNAFILGFNHNAAKEGNNRIHWAIGKISGTQVALCDSKYNSGVTDGTKCFNTNHWGNYNYGGWKGCDARYDILGSTNKAPSGYGSAAKSGRVGYDPDNYDIVNSPVANTLMAALPQALRKVMKTVTKYTDNVAGGTGDVQGNVTASVDYLFRLGEKEVYGGSRTYANSYEANYQEQYDYFKAGNSKQLYKHDARTTAVWAPLRSSYYNGNRSVGAVGSGSGGSVYYYFANYAGGLFAGFST